MLCHLFVSWDGLLCAVGRGSLGKHGGREGGGGTAGGFPDGTSSATALRCLLPRLAPRQGHGCQWPLQDGSSPCSSPDWLSPRPLPETELHQAGPWPGQQEGRCPSSLDLSIISRTSFGVHHVWWSASSRQGFGQGSVRGDAAGVSSVSVRAATAACEDGCRCFGRRSRWEDKATAQKSRAQGCRHLRPVKGELPGAQRFPATNLAASVSGPHSLLYQRPLSPPSTPTRILTCDPQPCSANTVGCDLHGWFSWCTTAKPSRGTARGSLNVALGPTPGSLSEERVHGDGDAGSLQPRWAFVLK